MRRFALLSLLLIACGPQAQDEALNFDHAAASISFDDNQAFGVLALVNDPQTTFEILDIDVALDRRAANNIVRRRPFETIEQLDAVPWVGPKALEKLLQYAQDNGFVPEAEDDPALTVVNADDVTLELLDIDVGLDVRAARNIIAFRAGRDGRMGTADDQTFTTVEQLDRVPWVGRSALAKLRAYGANNPPDDTPDELGAGAVCDRNSNCGTNLRCQGIPNDGSVDTGLCVDTRPIRGEGDQCGRRQPCEDGLLCAGTTLWGEGNCVPQWMAGRYVMDQFHQIPDAPVPLTSSVVVTGLASVPVDITLTAQINHSRGTDLKITLIDPNGDEAVVWNRSNEVGRGVIRSFVTTGISRDDAVNGRWTLRVEDEVPNSGGWLLGWDLFIVSRWD